MTVIQMIEFPLNEISNHLDLGILSCKFLWRQHDNGNLFVATMTTIMTMKTPDKIK